MATTNYERVTKAMTLLREGLAPFVLHEIKNSLANGTIHMNDYRNFQNDPKLSDRSVLEWDVLALLKLMRAVWNDVFRYVLSQTDRSLVFELIDYRNKWAHQERFSSDDADRVLDSTERLLSAVSASQAQEVAKMKTALRRTVFEEQSRNERRKVDSRLVESASSAALKPWREVITPHADVTSGDFQQAEFAADLWQVHIGDGSNEYLNPKEFFRRTYLTKSIGDLLLTAVQRLSGEGGDPVVQLQTNFGGGKTHTMLALYHLFSGESPREFAGIEDLLSETGIQMLPKPRRVVLVGNRISPGNPTTKDDGTMVRTLWGELAWQLGGKTAYSRIENDDIKATSPGDVLRELFIQYGPCLILIDEWVAYARQLHERADLPAGSFETQFSFAQALTESAKLANNCMVVVSLPASDLYTSSDQISDIEVGGLRGRDALDRLRNVIQRVESSWRPATAEESFEIVRRRIFQPIPSSNFKIRDLVARTFVDQYRKSKAEFPKACSDGDYEQRLRAAYPIHPELFDRLYSDWSTLQQFQRTRGVLRLMAAVVHCLWEKGDRNPLILPSTVPIDDVRVQRELTRYLSDNWIPIIEKDVDGPKSLPVTIDNEISNLGKYSATRRVARTIYLGSAPITTGSQRGLNDRNVKLGCVMPNESLPIFGDALRRLASRATYLYQDGSRSWYQTKPTVTRIAADESEQLKGKKEKIRECLHLKLHSAIKSKGEFARVNILPRTGADVPDVVESTIVVLSPDQTYSQDDPAREVEIVAEEIMKSRGTSHRNNRNNLVFLAVDRVRWPDLEEALRNVLAWASILDKRDTLNLDPHQNRQATTQQMVWEQAVTARLLEAYRWLLVREQITPNHPETWQVLRLSGSDKLAIRASKRLIHHELLLTRLAGTILRKYMDDVPLWAGNHVEVRMLASYFTQYHYLPRLRDPNVLTEAIRDGLRKNSWKTNSFAFAESYDDDKNIYRGLRNSSPNGFHVDGPGLLVKIDVAEQQVNDERSPKIPEQIDVPKSGDPISIEDGPFPTPPVESRGFRRFHASADLDPILLGSSAGQIGEEIIVHLNMPGAEVRVTLEIEVMANSDFPENTVSIVKENSNALKLRNVEFEPE